MNLRSKQVEKASRLQYGYIESVLFDYKREKMLCEIHADDNLPSVTAVWSDMPHGTDTSDSTARCAIKRLKQLKYCSEMQEQVDRVEKAFDSLTAIEKQVCQLRYFDRLKRYEVEDKLFLSGKQFEIIRKNIVKRVEEALE